MKESAADSCEVSRNGSQDLTNLYKELEQLKKEKNLATGLIAQLQRDMNNKDVMIGRFGKEIEDLKKEILNKENQVVALKAVVENPEWNFPSDENVIKKEQEIALLNQKLKSAENQKQESVEKISLLMREASQLKTAVDLGQASISKHRLDLAADQAKRDDLERAERLVRVALEQVSKRLEKLRSRVIQTAYCAPGSKVTEKQVISDDDLLMALKKLIDDHTELVKKMKVIDERQLMNKTADSAKRLKQQIGDSVDNVKKK